jgi:hypothetical protein
MVMKRIPAVAVGVALCALATGADARADNGQLASHYGYRPSSEGDWENARPYPTRRSDRAGKRRHAADRPGRRHAARSGRRGGAARRNPVSRRGVVAFARAGGTSRTCLTPAARDLLSRIEAQFGPVGIISTCRPGAIIAGSGRPSRHASGNAIDFNAPSGRKGEMVRWLIANHRSGGVMTYAAMNHIHVDIGQRFVSLGSGGRRLGQAKRGPNT